MAETILNSALTITRWRKRYFTDYLRESRFRPYMGPGNDNIIVTLMELESQAGKTIILPIVKALTGTGVSGSQVLEGNEEDLGTNAMPISIDWRRNAVVVPKSEQYKTDIDLLDAARPELKRWEAVMLRKDIIREFGAITVNDASQTSVPYASASEAQKDAYLALNADRVLFGINISNNSGNDWSASLANIDTTADRASAAMLTKAKRMAQKAKITPYQSDQTAGREWYVAFAGTETFRDLAADPAILEANLEARVRGVDTNPVFQGGDLIYQGIIIREEPELPVYTGVGASTSDVSPIYLAGVQSIGVAWGQTPQSKTRLVDYDFRKGVGIEELLGVKKVAYDGITRGFVTVLASAPADA
jgi:N4-gp56 family major capsid protein